MKKCECRVESEIYDRIDELAAPRYMTLAEALEYYADVKRHCEEWIDALSEDIKREEQQ